MTRTLFLLALSSCVLSLASKAPAQQSLPTAEMKRAVSKNPVTTTFYDQYGRKVGSARTSSSRTSFYDPYGSKTGSRSTTSRGFTFLDRYGSKLSTSRV